MPNEMIAILPPLIAIILAWASKKVIPGLVAGLIVGSFIMSPGMITGFQKTVEYIENSFADPGNLNVILFLYVFSGFVGLLKMSGGIQGFTYWVDQRVHSKRGTLMALWASFPLTFLDCGYRVVATGAIFNSLSKKYHIARERLAFMLNNSASPVIILIPLATTFVGFLVGVIDNGLDVAGVNQSAFRMYFQSLPLNFFSITAILVAIGSILFKRDFPKMRSLQEQTDDQNVDNQNKEEKREGKIWNLIFPIGVIIILSVYLMWWSGHTQANSFWMAIMNADASQAMFLALFITTLLTIVFYLIQGFSVQELTNNFFKQANQMMKTITILALAWPLAAVTKDLGLAQLMVSVFSDALPGFLVPALVFIFAAFVSYFIGSSWGTFALLMPMAISLAVTTSVPLPLAIGAVLAGGTFGDITSPLSGMTVMAANSADADHMSYVRAQMPYNFLAFGIALLLFVVAPFLA